MQARGKRDNANHVQLNHQHKNIKALEVSYSYLK